MSKRNIHCSFFASALALVLIGLVLANDLMGQEAKWPIITRKGDQLFEDDRPFRFFGLAAPNI